MGFTEYESINMFDTAGWNKIFCLRYELKLYVSIVVLVYKGFTEYESIHVFDTAGWNKIFSVRYELKLYVFIVF